MAHQDQSMSGKVCMVTGGTSGIGEVTARTLAQRGATVVVVGRDPERSARTVGQIKEQTGSSAVGLLLADLSSQGDIRRLVQQFESEYQRLDVLVNNAGALFAGRQLSVDRIEMTFAVNYLAPFLLTNLLLSRLRASAPSRIINVSSDAHRRAKIDFDNLQGERRYGGFRAYGQAKLALLLFTYELSRRLKGTGVTANALHPGFVASRFGLNNPWPIRLAWRILTRFAISPEQGAETTIYLATSPEEEGATGGYYDKMIPVHSSAVSYDLEAARKLWHLSAEMTGLSQGVEQVA